MAMGSKNGATLVAGAAAVGAIVAVAIFARHRAAKRERDDEEAFEVTFCLGGPGAGKGTQCEFLVRDFGYVHLSAGDLLREERSRGTELADMINDYIKNGKIVPAEVTVGLLRDAMEKSGGAKFLIDGFPRNEENFSSWEAIMGSRATTKAVLFLDCSEEVMTHRLMKRGETSGRVDDNLDAIKKRFATYRASTMPIVRMFEKRGLVRTVDAGMDVETVRREVRRVLVGM